MEVVKCLGQMSTKYWKTFSLCYNVPFKDTDCILGFTQSNFARNMIITIRLKYIYLKYSRHGLGLINNFCLKRNYNHFQSDSAIFSFNIAQFIETTNICILREVFRREITYDTPHNEMDRRYG